MTRLASSEDTQGKHHFPTPPLGIVFLSDRARDKDTNPYFTIQPVPCYYFRAEEKDEELLVKLKTNHGLLSPAFSM